MSKSSLDIIQSPTARDMLRMVTQGFYDNSYVALWLFEVIGSEYDDMAVWSEELKRECFIQTCTWSIDLWEWVYGISSNPTIPLEQRRAMTLAKRRTRPPINPALVEAVISAFAGCPVHITDPTKPYSFGLEVDESGARFPVDHKGLRALLNSIKPSHLRPEISTVISDEHSKSDYNVGVTVEYVTEFFIGDETPIERGVFECCAGAAMEMITEFHTEEILIAENAASYNGGAANEFITEVFTK